MQPNISAKIITDSLGPNGIRLTTAELIYPRYIHAEVMTHRVFSRNASSSRAIPVKRLIDEAIANPVIPIAFTRNQKGMQGGDALVGADNDAALVAWLGGRDSAVEAARQLSDLEVHKQYSNRILEPFTRITVIVTSTQWTNFFALRNHPAAQPEIQEVARQLFASFQSSQPAILEAGRWHLPFIAPRDWDEVRAEVSEDQVLGIIIRRSVARAARASYRNHDGTATTIEQDLGLYDRLAAGIPMHASPMEHQAMATTDRNIRSGNFRGWVQYRQGLPNQNISSYEDVDEEK